MRPVSEARLLATLLITFALLWAGAELADGFDAWLLMRLRAPGRADDPVGPEWFEGAVRDLTSLGSVAVLSLVILATAGHLLVIGRRRAVLAVLFFAGAGQLMSSAAKLSFHRPRPDLVPHEVQVLTSSFPSNHAVMSAIVYLTVGALLAEVEPRARAPILAAAVALTLIVGSSRVYLGVHWPTDVLGGWFIGTAWASLAWWTLRRMKRPD